jgi:hypothetical protein
MSGLAARREASVDAIAPLRILSDVGRTEFVTVAPDAGRHHVEVTLFDPDLRVPDLVIMGSHCIGPEIVLDALAERGVVTRTVAIGSLSRGGEARRVRHRPNPSDGPANRSL